VRTELIRPVEKQDAEIMHRHNDAISRALVYAAESLGTREWCAGNSITLADLALVSSLIYLDLRQPERDWRSIHANLARWFTRMNERTSVRSTLAESASL